MKRRVLLVTIVTILMIFAFVSCSNEVAPEDTLGMVTFGEDPSAKAVTTDADYTYNVEDLVWFYKAEKLDDGYITGQTTGFVTVAAFATTTKTVDTNGANSTVTVVADSMKGLSGKTLNAAGFSYGLWKIELQGFTEDNITIGENAVTIKTNATAEYKSTINNLLVNKGMNYAKAVIELGDNPTTKVVFKDISFSLKNTESNVTENSKFTLTVTDTLTNNTDTKFTVYTDKKDDTSPVYSIADPTVTVTNGVATITSKQLYLRENGESIVGKHTMTFVLSQVLKNKDDNNATVENTTVEAALYTLYYEVKAGTTTEVYGTLVSNDPNGAVQINSVQDVEPITLGRALDVTGVTTTGTSATTTRVQTLKVPGFTVTIPANTTVTTTKDSVTIDDTTAETGTADATIGSTYVDDSKPTGGNINITADDSSTKYDVTLPAAADNSTLIQIDWFYGKNKEVKTVVHNTTELPAATDSNTSEERYGYNKETGILTLYLKHASPLYVITRDAVAKDDNGNEYYSLSEAINGDTKKSTTGVEAGGTVTLLRDITLSEEIEVKKSFTLDMGRKTITVENSGAITVGENGVVTVQNAAAAQASGFIKGIEVSDRSGIAGVYYPTASKALDAVTDGQVVTLFKDDKLEEGVALDKSVTVDLNSKTLTLGNYNGMMVGAYESPEVDVVIKNGKLVHSKGTGDTNRSDYSIMVYKGNILTLDGVTMTGGEGAECGIYVNDENGASLAVNNSTLNLSAESGIEFGGGTPSETVTGSVTITNSTVLGSKYGLNLQKGTSATLENSELKGTTASLALFGGSKVTGTLKEDSSITVNEDYEGKVSLTQGDAVYVLGLDHFKEVVNSLDNNETTIRLLADVTVDKQTLTDAKSFTVDLNGKCLILKACLNFGYNSSYTSENVSVNVKNGTVEIYSGGYIEYRGNSTGTFTDVKFVSKDNKFDKAVHSCGSDDEAGNSSFSFDNCEFNNTYTYFNAGDYKCTYDIVFKNACSFKVEQSDAFNNNSCILTGLKNVAGKIALEYTTMSIKKTADYGGNNYGINAQLQSPAGDDFTISLNNVTIDTFEKAYPYTWKISSDKNAAKVTKDGTVTLKHDGKVVKEYVYTGGYGAPDIKWMEVEGN